MKSLFIPSLFISFLFSACNGNHSGKAPSSLSTRSKTVLHSFKDSIQADTFRIVLKGSTPEDMELVFTITPKDGVPVYTAILKAKKLIDNYSETVDLGKEDKQLLFLEEELSQFFDEENFLEPAVTENETPNDNTPDKVFFNELKKTGLDGFKYRTGKESKVYIAWSDLEKKVKVYYQCCVLKEKAKQ
jgi:hypothetical protein